MKLICAVQVICGHFEEHCSSRLGIFSIHDSAFGRTDVLELFFLISGFLFANGIARIKEKSYANFIVSKIKRFYPIIVLTVVAEIFVVLVYYFISGEMLYELRLWQIIMSCLNFNRAGIFFMQPDIINTYMWYIEMLLLCDSIMFFFVWISKKGLNQYVLTFIMLLIGTLSMSQGMNMPLLNFYTSRAYVGFFFGVLLCRFYNMIQMNEKVVKWLTLISVMLIIVWCVFDFVRPEAIDNIYFSEVFMLFPAIIFLCLYLNRYISNSQFASKCGEISFQIYVWQSLAFTIREILGRRYPIFFTKSVISMYLFVLCIFLWGILYLCIKRKIKK